MATKANTKPKTKVLASTIQQNNYNTSETGKKALKRLRKAGHVLSENFYLFDMTFTPNAAGGCGAAVLRGAEFRVAERGVTAGSVSVRVPGTTRTVYVEI